MTDVRFYVAIGVPMLFNALLITIFANSLNRRFEDSRDFWRAEFGGAKSELRGVFHISQANAEIRVGELRALIKRNHSELLSRFAAIDARLARIENDRGILQ
jgi:hypothetical protein